MLRHEDTTFNVDRTREELTHIGYSIDEINVVIDGYPALDDRLYVPEGEHIPFGRTTILGRAVTIYEIPSGHDATNSIIRQATLDGVNPEEFLFGPPDPDKPTGGDWMLAEEDPAVIRAIRARCRDFTQHRQPLMPGWRQLLALKTSDGTKPLGMPTNIGWYTHLGLSKMCDAVTMRLSKASNDIEVLLYERPEDPQSEWVWATPGGYVVKADALQPDKTPLQAASARRTEDRTRRDVLAHRGVPLRVKYPVSSGNTLVAGLETTPFARFVNDPDYISEPRMTSRQERLRHDIGWAAGYIGLRDLCEHNPNGGVSGKNHGDNPFPIWTTHLEYVLAGLDAITDPENRLIFDMSLTQLMQIRQTVEDLQSRYELLRTV